MPFVINKHEKFGSFLAVEFYFDTTPGAIYRCVLDSQNTWENYMKHRDMDRNNPHCFIGSEREKLRTRYGDYDAFNPLAKFRNYDDAFKYAWSRAQEEAEMDAD